MMILKDIREINKQIPQCIGNNYNNSGLLKEILRK